MPGSTVVILDTDGDRSSQMFDASLSHDVLERYSDRVNARWSLLTNLWCIQAKIPAAPSFCFPVCDLLPPMLLHFFFRFSVRSGRVLFGE